MKKIILFLCILFISCADNDNENSVENSILIKKIISTNQLGNDLVYDFTYDGNKIVKIVKSDGTYNKFTYSGNVIVKHEILYTGSDVAFQRKEFFYNSNKLIKIIYKDLENNIGYRIQYEHVNNNLINFKKYNGDVFEQNSFSQDGFYVLENNNVIQSNFNTIDSQGNPQVRTLNFTFDDKNTPMKNVVGYDKVAIDLSQYGIKNNFINYTASYTGSSNVGTYNIAYIYDENDFPASSVFTSSFNNYTENQFFYE